MPYVLGDDGWGGCLSLILSQAPTAPATWRAWPRDPAAPHFPFHLYVQVDHTTDRAAGTDPDTEMQRQIATAAAIKVGQEVHELNAAPRKSFF